MIMSGTSVTERLHRTAKLFMDSGEVNSAEEAMGRLQGYQLSISVGPDIATSSTLQAALLTTVNTGRRCFLGGVHVKGSLDVELLVPWKRFTKLADAVRDLQGIIGGGPSVGAPEVYIGDASGLTSRSPFAVQATFNGWAGGVIPCSEGKRLAERQDFIPAGILAGAIAVSEAFQHVRGNVQAGRRDVGLSLWQPGASRSWMDCEEQGPSLSQLPSNLWVIGLGHLGQAFLWTLGLLPYADPTKVKLFLHDYDFLEDANDSTSPLTFLPIVGRKKTRALAEWCDERGFNTIIIERKFHEGYQLSDDDPKVALCGVDNAQARAVLEDIGFKLVIEAGLGKGVDEYLAFQVHTFPGPQTAKRKWNIEPHVETFDEVTTKPAYANLAEEGLDECGITRLAGRSVGASFVGTAVSTMVVSELLRMLHGGTVSALIDGTLGSLKNRQVIDNCLMTEPFNPGTTQARKR